MAVAGGGVPSKRMYIFARQLRQVGLSHNVDASVVLTPEQAAPRIAQGEACYIESVGNYDLILQEILEDWGYVDPVMDTRQWLAWVTGKV